MNLSQADRERKIELEGLFYKSAKSATDDNQRLSSSALTVIKRQQPKSLSDAILKQSAAETASPRTHPKLIVPENFTLQIGQKPNILFKKAQIQRKLRQYSSDFITQLMQLAGDHVDVELSGPLRQQSASQIRQAVQQVFDDLFHQSSQAKDLTPKHQRVFVTAIAQYIAQIQAPKMGTFQAPAIMSVQSIRVENDQLEAIFTREYTLDGLATKQHMQKLPLERTLTVPESHLQRTCDKLYSDYKRKEAKLVEAMRAKSESEAAGCTFQPLTRTMGVEGSKDFGSSHYVEKRRKEVAQDAEIRIQKYLQEISVDVEKFGIQLTENFTEEVKSDLQATNDVGMQREIVKRIKEQLQEKYHQLTQEDFKNRLKSGQIRRIEDQPMTIRKSAAAQDVSIEQFRAEEKPVRFEERMKEIKERSSKIGAVTLYNAMDQW